MEFIRLVLKTKKTKRPKLSINQRAFAAGSGGFIQQFLTPITPPALPAKTVGQTNEECEN
jgi:hypothetical protein